MFSFWIPLIYYLEWSATHLQLEFPECGDQNSMGKPPLSYCSSAHAVEAAMIEELREDPAFEWNLKALSGDESGWQGRLALDHMVMDKDGKHYNTHWPQGKTATKGMSLQWIVPNSLREQLLVLHHNTPVSGHLGHDKL